MSGGAEAEQSANGEDVRAAGGLVTREGMDGLEVLVVHRRDATGHP